MPVTHMSFVTLFSMLKSRTQASRPYESRNWPMQVEVACPICGKQLLKGSLRKHVDAHDPSTKRPCQYCQKLFNRQSDRTRHEKKCSQNPNADLDNVECSHCHQEFTLEYNLKIHLKGRCPVLSAKVNAPSTLYCTTPECSSSA